MLNCRVLTEKLLKMKQIIFLFKMNLKKLQTFDSSYFIGKNYFEEDGTQNYLVFQPVSRYYKIIANTKFISSWESKGLSNETITPYATSDNSLTQLIGHYDVKIRLKFNKSCLKQSNKLTYSYGNRVNVYMGIVVLVLGLIEDQASYFLVVDLVKRY